MEVRPGTLADIAAIADIEISASELFRGTHMSWATGETTDPAELAAAIARDHLWVAEIDGKLAGFLQADVCDGTFHICETAVHQSYRGQRVGAALIGFALAEAAMR